MAGDNAPRWTGAAVPAGARPPRRHRTSLLVAVAVGALVAGGLITYGLLELDGTSSDGGLTEARESEEPLDTSAGRGSDEAGSGTVDGGSEPDTRSPSEVPPSSGPVATLDTGADDADRQADAEAGTTANTTQPSPAVSRCEVNVLRRDLRDDGVECERGTVAIAESTGPWHTELRAVWLSDGITGEIHLERRDDGSTQGPAIQELSPGLNVLNPVDAAFGVSRVFLLFRLAGDHAHLHANADLSGRLTTLTFEPS